MLGLERTNSANVSLLNNFEIVATSMIAFFVFWEALSKRLTVAIVLVTAASIALSFEGEGSFRFNGGSLLVLGAAKTSAYYSIAPFLGVVFGVLLLNERPGIRFYVGLIIMILATVLMVKDTIALQHTHEHSHVHTHQHRHGDLVHTHVHEHCHTHTHIHGENESVHDHSYGTDDAEAHIHNHN